MVAEQCSLVAKLLSIIAINMENVLIRGLGCKAYIDVESRLSDLMRTILSLFFLVKLSLISLPILSLACV